MYGVLDLVWIPSQSSPEPKPGQTAAIVRGDTYSLLVPFVTPSGEPFIIEGEMRAQIRQNRLTGDSTEPPLAEFNVLVNGNEILLTLTPEQTIDLPETSKSYLYWDVQSNNEGVVTTWLAGRVKVADHVTVE